LRQFGARGFATEAAARCVPASSVAEQQQQCSATVLSAFNCGSGVASPGFQHMYRLAPKPLAIMVDVQQGCTRVSLARFFPRRTRFPPLRGAVPARPSQDPPHAETGGESIRLSEARWHAVSSRNMYSEHGLEARTGDGFCFPLGSGQVLRERVRVKSGLQITRSP
jgi:hypothetical protein